MSNQDESSSLEGTTHTLALAEHAAAIRRLRRRVIGNVIEIGRRLCECKPLVGHGNWLSWLKREFDLSERTARNYMEAHKFVERTSANVADLRIELTTLYLIAAPGVPDEVRAEVLSEAAARRVPRAEIKAMIARSVPSRGVSVRQAIAELGHEDFAKLPRDEQAKILEMRPANPWLASRDARTRLAWKPPYRALQNALDALETVGSLPIGKVIAAIPAEHVSGVAARVERAKTFLEKLDRRLLNAKEARQPPVDEKAELSLLLAGARKKYGRHSPAQILELVWRDLTPAQIALLQSDQFGQATKAAAERLASKAPSR